MPKQQYIWDFWKELKWFKTYMEGLKDPVLIDLGCRHGNSLFHAYHELGIKKLEGIELSSREFTLSDASFFNSYSSYLSEDIQKLFSSDVLSLYAYYHLIRKKLFAKESVVEEVLFEQTFPIRYECSVEDFLAEAGKEKTDSYDLLIIGKVLHYLSIPDPKAVVQQASQLLKENGVLFIKTWVKEWDHGRRRPVYEEDVQNWIEGLETVEYIREGELAYLFLRRKASQG